jgi:hypothetical protein
MEQKNYDRKGTCSMLTVLNDSGTIDMKECTWNRRTMIEKEHVQC